MSRFNAIVAPIECIPTQCHEAVSYPDCALMGILYPVLQETYCMTTP
jgi:hypothetical protein